MLLAYMMGCLALNGNMGTSLRSFDTCVEYAHISCRPAPADGCLAIQAYAANRAKAMLVGKY